MSDDRWQTDGDEDPLTPGRAPLPRLSNLPKPKAKPVTADEIFTWLKDVYEKRFGITAKPKKAGRR
jgi:hypothetical protein